MAIDLDTLSIAEARKQLDAGDITAEALTEASLKRIEEKNPSLNAYLEVFDDALSQAKAADVRIKSKQAALLTGIPLSIKDNILIEGKRASAASRILEGYTATYDATAIAKLKTAGAVFVGRTNMDEFAMGGSTENSAFGVTKNPVNPLYVAGGSSGGAAASVSMGAALGALGSDTGGSVRQPASYCGIVGLKPTYGSVSRHGLIAMGSSLDVIGTFGKTVADAKIIFDAIKGGDPKDSTSIAIVPPTAPNVIGVPRRFFENDGLHPGMREKFNRALDILKDHGYTVVDVELPNIAYALSVYYVLMPAEASTNLARFDGMRYGLRKEGNNLFGDYAETRGSGFGKEVRRRILLGTYVLSAGYYDAYYNKAVAVRKLITDEFRQAFSKVGIIMMPTTPGTAFKIGEKGNDPLQMYLEDIFTVPANIAGIPALSVPGGLIDNNGDKLPVGIQLLGSHGTEEALFAAASVLEKAA